MKYLVLSDIHGSAQYARMIPALIAAESPGRLILLGDLYYHGPRNPLPEGYDPRQVCAILNQYRGIITCIRGNCDAEVDEMISEFRFIAGWHHSIAGKRFFFTHGHKYNAERLPPDTDVLVYGHSHIGGISERDGVLLMNPGSLSLPKENTPRSYLTIDDQGAALKGLDGRELASRHF